MTAATTSTVEWSSFVFAAVIDRKGIDRFDKRYYTSFQSPSKQANEMRDHFIDVDLDCAQQDSSTQEKDN